MKGSNYSNLQRIAGATVLVLVGIVAYLCAWPVPAEPQSWIAPTPLGYVGVHAPNSRLADLRTIDIGSEFGPEHIAIGPDGKLYAAMTSGALVRMNPDGANRETFANTGGRVLGFDFDAQDRMIAADAMKGLLAITSDGAVRVLTDRVSPDDPVRYANSIVVARDGTIYFTDACGRFAPIDWGGTLEASVLDILEQAATGRVLAHDPATGLTRIVAQGFSFANGIALSADEQTLFVSETGRYRIWKVDHGARDLDVRSGSPQASALIDNLPGYPDNLMRGREGRIWVGLFRPRNPAADGLSQRPAMRKVLLRLPRSLLPVGDPHGHVFAFTEDGRVAELRACFGATPERARQNFYAEIELGGMSFRGSGECFALMTDFPEAGLFPVRCQLVLIGLPAPFVGGLLTTNTITSGARFGGESDPPGYTQASIATIRLWRGDHK